MTKHSTCNQTLTHMKINDLHKAAHQTRDEAKRHKRPFDIPVEVESIHDKSANKSAKSDANSFATKTRTYQK